MFRKGIHSASPRQGKAWLQLDCAAHWASVSDQSVCTRTATPDLEEPALLVLKGSNKERDLNPEFILRTAHPVICS